MGKESSPPHKEVHIKDESFVHNLRFGDGDLLKDGTSDLPTGRTLKGRYIVRVGWDDVRGWFGVVSVSGFPTSFSLSHLPGWYTVWYSTIRGLPYSRRPSLRSLQPNQGGHRRARGLWRRRLPYRCRRIQGRMAVARGTAERAG